MPGNHRGRPAAFVLLLILAGCAAPQVLLDNPLSPVAGPAAEFVLAAPSTLKATNARATVLRTGTRWFQVGTIPQGDVFRSRDQVTIVNSFDVDEAYIVISGDQVVGYYLPVRGSFVPAIKSVGIQKLK